MDTIDILLVLAGLGLLFWKGGISWQGVVDKAKQLLAKNEKGESAAPVKLDSDTPELPPLKVEIPLNTRQKVDWYEVDKRLEDGVQFVDVIFFVRILFTLLQIFRPLIQQRAREEIAKIEAVKESN